MRRFADELKEHWEDQTLGIFFWFRRESGGPDYELAARGERPDRRIRIRGESEIVGAEITRMVLGEDAGERRYSFHLGKDLTDVLQDHGSGGHVYLYTGSFPDTSRAGRARLCADLRSAIRAAGSMDSFLSVLPNGQWEHDGTVFVFSEVGEQDSWEFTNNAVKPTWASSVDEAVLDELLLGRIADKAQKAPNYPWRRPLILLVRNPYQPYCPPDSTLARVRTLAGSAFQEAWLVNHREGVLDLKPPEPRLVRLV